METTRFAELKDVLQAMEQALGWLDQQRKHIAAAHLDRCLHELRRPLTTSTESKAPSP